MSQNNINPTILVIFGATGELSRERLIPALYHLFDNKLLPNKFFVVGFARSAFSSEEFRNKIKPEQPENNWTKFANKIFYQPGNFTVREDFLKLAKILHKLENRGHSLPGRQAGCANRLFYFATLPSHYETISHELEKSGLLIGGATHKRKTRAVVEKPFGHDLKSALKLDQTLHKYFAENQIYRIDHYLGKETAHKIVTTDFDPHQIDHVQISTLMQTGVGNRGVFYEQTGTLKDVFQNHLIQLVAIVATHLPQNSTTEFMRGQRAATIASIRKPKPSLIGQQLVLGQYETYRREPNVARDSRIETFAAVRLELEKPSWEHVAFYLRAGLHLGERQSQVTIHLKNGETLTFKFKSQENSYERLLMDFFAGDQKLFAGTEEIEYSWKYIDRLEELRAKLPLRIYPDGSAGPKEAETLIQKNGRKWDT